MEESIQSFSLAKLKKEDVGYIETLFKWHTNETRDDRFTCRPLKKISTLSEYMKNISTQLDNNIQIYVLKGNNKSDSNIYGKVALFDFNHRNRSAEFGYYLPLDQRGKGLGKLMIKEFIDTAFMNEATNLNKLYATTASGNRPSIKLLDHFGFELDGRLREHYWFENDVQDQLVYSLLRKEWKESKI